MKTITYPITLLSLIGSILSCSPPEEEKSQALPSEITYSSGYLNEYPTRDRVNYVLNCVGKHGGLTYITQYACGCKVDKIAEKLTFKDFEAATTFTYMRKTPGENGAAFRDPEQSKNLIQRLKDAETNAEKNCFVNS